MSRSNLSQTPRSTDASFGTKRPTFARTNSVSGGGGSIVKSFGAIKTKNPDSVIPRMNR